ncbi:hypothetical protein AgCh_033418 [Apium graveolens]
MSSQGWKNRDFTNPSLPSEQRGRSSQPGYGDAGGVYGFQPPGVRPVGFPQGHKVNGVPLRRVNQTYVIGTSTMVDISGVNVEKFDDKAKEVTKKNKKGEWEFFAGEYMNFVMLRRGFWSGFFSAEISRFSELALQVSGCFEVLSFEDRVFLFVVFRRGSLGFSLWSILCTSVILAFGFLDVAVLASFLLDY